MTLALDFPSRCQCKKLISVYLKLFSFQMVIQSMKYGTIHIHVIPREALWKNCDLFALEGQRKAFSSNSLQLCFHMLPTLLIFLPRKSSLVIFFSYSTSNLSCSGLFLGKRTCFFSKAIFSCNGHSSIMVLPWLDRFGNTEMWKGALGSHGDEKA